MLELESGHYRVCLDPNRGGSVAAFEWSGIPIFRSSSVGSMLDAACFPLVPFSNRIAHGRFAIDGKTHRLPPNFPEADPKHPLHGYGWLNKWETVVQDRARAVIEHTYEGEEWPWPYRARQYASVGDNGLFLQLEVTNLSERTMPAGLGFHPYFPRRSDTTYLGLHRGEWQVDDECLPVSLLQEPGPKDWWNGRPVESRTVDTVYSDRAGPLVITWPDLATKCAISASENLSSTVVYTPADRDFFCVEPVSHPTDAINRSGGGMTMLAPGGTMQAWMHLEVGHSDASIG